MLGSLPLPAPPTDGNLGLLPLSQVTENSPPHDNVSSAPDPPPCAASVATHTRTIGIIHPPPDIRIIVDKAAHFVAKHGPGFEKKVMANHTGDAKFSFFNASDPYNAYYQHRLSAERTPQTEDSSGLLERVQSDGDAKEVTETESEPVPKVLVPPESEKYTVRLPEGITGEELDIIKLTAQFAARNGKSFLTGLTSREINNPQFQFLTPTHSKFMFFTSLVDAYSKVLMPAKDLAEKLCNSVVDVTTFLERCLHRLEWERSQEQARLTAEDETEQERMQMAMIDWHDSVVVEAIDFVDDEDKDLPPPMTLEEVIRRSKKTPANEDVEPVEHGLEADMEMDEQEVKLVMDGNDDEKKRAEPEAPMRIVNNWRRPEERIPAERDPTKLVVSPITGELIPVHEMSEHMRISLIDPKYREQKERMMAKIRDTTLAKDDEISRNIVSLARTRPDIFGTTEEEVSNAIKVEVEKSTRTANQGMSQSPAAPPPKPGVLSVRPLPWQKTMQYLPGDRPQHPISFNPVHQSMILNRPPQLPQPVSMNPPGIHVPLRPPGWLPSMHMTPPPPFMHHGRPSRPPPLPKAVPPPLPEEPEPKRQKVEDQLTPEAKFLGRHRIGI